MIQEELASDLVTRGILSDWFSRDDDAPLVAPLRKRPNPRNVANAAKAEELERELQRYDRDDSFEKKRGADPLQTKSRA